MLEEHAIFRSKPNVVSVCGGICRALPFAKQKKRHWFHNEASDVLKRGVFLYFIVRVFYLCIICV